MLTSEPQIRTLTWSRCKGTSSAEPLFGVGITLAKVAFSGSGSCWHTEGNFSLPCNPELTQHSTSTTLLINKTLTPVSKNGQCMHLLYLHQIVKHKLNIVHHYKKPSDLTWHMDLNMTAMTEDFHHTLNHISTHRPGALAIPYMQNRCKNTNATLPSRRWENSVRALTNNQTVPSERALYRWRQVRAGQARDSPQPHISLTIHKASPGKELLWMEVLCRGKA